MLRGEIGSGQEDGVVRPADPDVPEQSTLEQLPRHSDQMGTPKRLFAPEQV